MTVEEARERIGSGVVYIPDHGPREDGIITSVGNYNVFVRYKGDTHSKATNPATLEFLTM